MGTLHVCFADTPQYGKSVSVISAAVVDGVDEAAALTLQRPQQELHSSAPSSSSVSPTPRYERNMSFFQQLSRRFGLRSSDDPVYSAEDDSTDSCSSTTGTMPPMQCSSANSMSSSMSSSNNNHNNNNSNSARANASSYSTNTKPGHGCSMERISCTSSDTGSALDIDEQQQQPAAAQIQTAEVLSQPAPKPKERKSSARASFSRLHRRSTSSIRRAFESFSLSSRSLSCSGATLPPAPNTCAAGSNGGTPIKSALKSKSNVELHKRANSVTLLTTATTTTTMATATTTATPSGKSSKGKTKPPPQRILRQPVSYTYLKGISGLPTQRVPRSAVCCQYARR